jgi:hypothetical protein
MTEIPKSTELLLKKMDKLEKDVKNLEQKLNSKQKKDAKHFSILFRKLGVVFLVILTALSINLSVASFWLQRNVTNTDVWVEKTSELIKAPEIQKAIASEITTRIFNKIDAKQLVGDALPGKASLLAGPITGSLRSFTEDKVANILASPKFLQFWEAANRSGHEGILVSIENANEDKSNANNENLLIINNEALLLNLQPVFNEIRSTLVDSGLSFINKMGKLPGGAPTIVITRIQNMQNILLIFNVVERASIVFILIAIISGFGALVLSRERRQTIIAICASVIALMVVNVQVIYLARYPLVQNAIDTLGSNASSSATKAFDIFSRDLIYMDRLLMITCLIVIIGAILIGPSRFARGLRDGTKKIINKNPNSTIVSWVSTNTILAISILGVVSSLLIVFPPISGPIFPIIILCVFIILVIFVVSLKKNR